MSDLHPRLSPSERRWLILASLLVLALSSLPYLFGVLAAGPERVFTGLQVNPLDGMSYLAKMRIGWNGGWLFNLPFTIERGPGAFLFTYFIALGHLARITGLPLILVYHLARLIGGFALLWMTYLLIVRMTGAIDLRRRAWWIVALSSGLGWLATLLGYGDTSDMTIPESNTFYSLVANAHFALAMAIMLGMFVLILETHRWSPWRIVALCVLSVALAIIQPFAPFAVYIVVGVTLLVIAWRDKTLPRFQFSAAAIAGLVTTPVLLYLYLDAQADPVLRVWSQQNQTPSPPPIDYLLGYGLLWLFAFFGARQAWRRKSDWDILLIVWIVVTLPLLYAPVPLQRRLSLGLHIPIGILAACGLTQLVHAMWPRRAVIAVTLLTSLLIELALLGGAAARDPHIFLTVDESAALNWLQAHAPADAIVLASPDTGAFIPAFAGQRVVYGHPYETADAPRKEHLVTDFFAGNLDRAAMLRQYQIGYLFIGPRERQLGQVDLDALPVQKVFSAGDVSVYAVKP